MTLIDKAEALAPCPFCGGEAEWKSGGPGCAWISCKSCPAETGDGSIPRIMEAWNRRAALPARGVGVKPLVWKQEADNAWVAAHYAIHQYWPHNNGPFAVSGYLGGLGAISLGKHPTLDAAKAAAQADYEARILAALAPTDAERVNETPKSEHDAGNVLTAAQAREAALHIENAKRLRRYDWQEWTAQDLEDAEGVICAFLALIGEKRA